MFIVERLIARPKRDVFGFLAELEHTPSWYSAVRSVRPLSPGPIGKGSTFEFTRQLGANEVTNKVIVSAFEPDKVLELTSISGPTPFTYRYEIDSAIPGQTVLRLLGRITGDGLSGPMRLLAPLAESFFETGMRTNLEALANLIVLPAGSLLAVQAIPGHHSAADDA